MSFLYLSLPSSYHLFSFFSFRILPLFDLTLPLRTMPCGTGSCTNKVAGMPLSLLIFCLSFALLLLCSFASCLYSVGLSLCSLCPSRSYVLSTPSFLGISKALPRLGSCPTTAVCISVYGGTTKTFLFSTGKAKKVSSRELEASASHVF